MNAVLSELCTYLFKFFCMFICAGAGIAVGRMIRKKKDAENNNEAEEQ